MALLILRLKADVPSGSYPTTVLVGLSQLEFLALRFISRLYGKFLVF